MVMRRNLARIGFVHVACLGAACLGAGSLALSPSAWAATCAGPPALEARLHAHPSADAYAALGTWFDQNHKTDCAVQTFQAGLEVAPESAGLHYLLGLSLYSAGRMPEAVEPLQQSVELDPRELKAHLLLAAAFGNLGHYPEALTECEAALKIDPASKIALDGLGDTLLSLGDYDAIIRRLRSAPRDESLTLDIGTAYTKTGRLDDAKQVLTEGLKKYPNSADLTGALVTVYLDQSRFEAASALAEKLARMNPRDLEAQRIYLRTLVSTGDKNAAAALGRKLLALAPHDPDLLNLNGFLERTAGDYAAARRHLEEAVALDPNNYIPRVNLGVVLAQLQDAAGARDQLQKAIELGASEPQVHFDLAKVLRTLGETDEAQRQLKLYQQGQKDEADTSLAVLKSTEAAQAVKDGDNHKAADLYREAWAARPDDPLLGYDLAHVLHDLGDKAGERAALEQAIKADPTPARAQYQLGYLEYQAGDYDAAEQHFRSVLDAAPDNFQAWLALAHTLGMQSHLQQAQNAVAKALKLEPNDADALKLNRDLAAALARH